MGADEELTELRKLADRVLSSTGGVSIPGEIVATAIRASELRPTPAEERERAEAEAASRRADKVHMLQGLAFTCLICDISRVGAGTVMYYALGCDTATAEAAADVLVWLESLTRSLRALHRYDPLVIEIHMRTLGRHTYWLLEAGDD